MESFGLIILYVYLIVSQIFVLWFWYLYSQTHNFISTLFIGPFVAEFKGIFFPFFI